VRSDYVEVENLFLSRFQHIDVDRYSLIAGCVRFESLSCDSHPQKTLSKFIKEEGIKEFESILMSGRNPTLSMSRWNSLKFGAVKSVFTCIPNSGPKSFENPVYACMIRQYLGLSHVARKSSIDLSRCKLCKQFMTRDGTHSLDCKSNGVVGRHDAVKTLLGSICSRAGIGNEVEPRGLDAESRVRPADVFIPLWNHSEAWVDIAVVNPSCGSMREGAALTPDHATDFMAKQKRRKYKSLIEDAGATFIPFMMDIYGALGKDAGACLKRISDIGARRNGLVSKDFYRESKLQLVCSVLKSTAIQILNNLEL
jgi:hypothetical protein